MALPKLYFLHPSQLCWPRFWVPVPRFSTLMTAASFKAVLQWCSTSCWWSGFPDSLQWWSVTGGGVTAFVSLRSALCLICIYTMQCHCKWGRRWSASQSKASGRQVHKSCHVFCLLGCSLTCRFVPLQVLSHHWQSHIWLEATWSSLKKRVCTWNIELMGLVFYIWVKSFLTLVHVRLPALLIKRLLAQPMFGSYSTAWLLIKLGVARGRDVKGLISACRYVSERE